MHPDAIELARHIDRVRRAWVVGRPDTVVHEMAEGWISLRPGGDPGEVPTTSANRVYWLAPSTPPPAEAVAAAEEVALAAGCSRLYVWLAPWAWGAEAETALAEAGASLWPHVRYPVLMRDATELPERFPTALTARAVAAADAAEVMEAVSAWYGAEHAAAVVRLIEHGAGELHAAFDATGPIAIAILTLDGDWAYVGAAGTDPDRRGRGAQKALICSRLERAVERGARRFAAETNTAATISQQNLEKCGFAEVFAWRVYRWDLRERRAR